MDGNYIERDITGVVLEAAKYFPVVCITGRGSRARLHLYGISSPRTYLYRDVRELVNVKDMMQFNTFLQLCAGRIGSLFNASELAAEVGVS